MISDAALTFTFGLVLLILFGWYLATDIAARKRWLGTLLTVLLVAYCIRAIWPPFDVKDANGKIIQHGKIHLGLDLQGGTSFTLQLKSENGQPIDRSLVDQAITVIDRRVNQFGVSE